MTPYPVLPKSDAPGMDIMPGVSQSHGFVDALDQERRL
jgi:hypothetical protein